MFTKILMGAGLLTAATFGTVLTPATASAASYIPVGYTPVRQPATIVYAAPAPQWIAQPTPYYVPTPVACPAPVQVFQQPIYRTIELPRLGFWDRDRDDHRNFDRRDFDRRDQDRHDFDRRDMGRDHDRR